MLRGAVVIFTGIFSVLFLRRKQYIYHWLGMVSNFIPLLTLLPLS